MTTTTIKLQFPAITGSFQAIVESSWNVIQLWCERAHQRRQLANLTPEQRRDVGITLDAARAETAKPFWRS